MNQRTQTAKRFLMIAACTGLFSLGMVVSSLGATLPEFRQRLNLDEAQAGSLFTFLYIPMIPMVFLVGPVIDRYGKRPILIVGSLGSALSDIGSFFCAELRGVCGAVAGSGSCRKLS